MLRAGEQASRRAGEQVNPRVALLSFLAWDPNYRIANAASVEIVFGDMLPRTESTAPPALGRGEHATGVTTNAPRAIGRWRVSMMPLAFVVCP
mgnify:CR=1 FL=1